MLKAAKDKPPENVQNGVESNSAISESNGEHTEHISKKQRIQEKITFEDLDSKCDTIAHAPTLSLSKVQFIGKLYVTVY